MTSNQLTPLIENFFEARKQLVAALRSTPTTVEPSDYQLSEGGSATSITDLFDGRNDLIVIHNMGKSCVYCTLWADGLNGMLPHLQSGSAIVLMNRDLPEIQREFAESRGWKFRMIRDDDGHFTKTMGFASETDKGLSLMPGFSTFHRNDDGSITRVAYDFFGPGDTYMPIFPMFELLHDGGSNWAPQYSYQQPITITLPEGH
ncbi:MAG: DUF899 family protein [Ignavibacteria bacterium]|nr:DUF899 family protein [Ignavibacteria bacterium]MBK7185132.1 DUF899 family protein [Ignavibacteria bacterium]MBK7576578.1 DUF899 family protein [Ignavibacteria bacterium]MBL0323199.1 DUF899 family protein [Ignavibacteria bacterium]